MTQSSAMFAIDFGSRFAGTTVIVTRDGVSDDAPLCYISSAKKQDADAMVADILRQAGDASVFIDAPLSLPGVYRGLEGCEDYFYRKADRELKAMSPMFLGGLTARAIRLRARFPRCTWFETYPAAQARRLSLDRMQYKKSRDYLPVVIAQVKPHISAPFDPAAVTTWHHFDALLCWLTAERCVAGLWERHGDPSEGMITI